MATDNYFEQLIEKKMQAGRYRERNDDLCADQYTIGALVSAVMSITNDANRFVEGYRLRLQNEPDLTDDVEAVIRANIGWCFGEGMEPERIAMWGKVCGASHPVFGTSLPSAQEAFDAGVELARGEQS